MMDAVRLKEKGNIMKLLLVGLILIAIGISIGIILRSSAQWHDAHLEMHHQIMTQQLKETKDIALSNGKKLDILLNIATNTPDNIILK